MSTWKLELVKTDGRKKNLNKAIGKCIMYRMTNVQNGKLCTEWPIVGGVRTVLEKVCDIGHFQFFSKFYI